MRVLFVAGTLARGGAERQLAYQARVLRAQGALPLVFSLTAGDAWQPTLEADGIEVEALSADEPRWRRLVRLRDVVQRFRPDIVQSAHFYTNLYAVVGAHARRVPSVGAVRSDTVWSVSTLPRPIGTLSLRTPTVLAVNSRRSIGQAEALGARPSRLIHLPNVVDVASFAAGPKREVTNAIRLVTVSRLEPVKRIDRLLRVVAACLDPLREARVDLAVTIVGDGSQRTRLESYARELKIEAFVQFVGASDDVGVHLAAADLFLLTSDMEGLPNTLLEAAAAGLPVVATDVGGVAEVVLPGVNGVLVEPRDEHLLAEAVLEMALDPSRRADFGRRARRLVMQERSLQALPRYLSNVYEVAHRR